MPANTTLYLQLECEVKDGMLEDLKIWVDKVPDTAFKAGSDYWSSTTDGKKWIHNESFSNIENFKRHMNEWVPTVIDDVGKYLIIEKVQVCGLINDE